MTNQSKSLSSTFDIMEKYSNFMQVPNKDSSWQNLFDGIDKLGLELIKMVHELCDETHSRSQTIQKEAPAQYVLITRILNNNTVDAEFIQMCRLIARVQEVLKGKENIVYLKHFINILSKMDDEDFKYRFSHSVIGNSFVNVPDVQRACISICISNPAATTWDFVNFLSYCQTDKIALLADEVMGVMSRIIEQEMAKTVPDFSKITNNIRGLNVFAESIKEPNVYNYMMDRIKTEFDINNITALQSKEYVARTPRNFEEIQSLRRQLELANKEKNQLEESVKILQSENLGLKNSISTLQTENNDLRKQSGADKERLAQMSDAASRLNILNVNKYKQFVRELQYPDGNKR